MSKFTSVVIARTILHPELEIYLDGELIGRIKCEPRSTGSMRLRIHASPALRFIKAEYNEKTKLAHIRGAAGEKRKVPQDS